MSALSYKELDTTYIAHTYGRFDVCFEKGDGVLLYDTMGKEYIDLGSGIGVTAFGSGDDVWQQAVIHQVKRLNHVSNLYHTLPQATLAEKLCKKTGMKKVFFSNSGAEANECAIKAARKYSADKYGDERTTVVTLVNSFHGRTITTLAATGQDVFHQHFHPFTKGFVHVPANDFKAFKQLVDSDPSVCAIMMEMIQGEGGVMPLDAGYVKQVADYAAAHDILVVVDEVQTGNGRTGTLYSYMQFGIAPDIVSTAKGLAGGLPMGATLFNDETEGVLDAGSHGSTFGGNPICAAGAISVIDRIDDALLSEVKAKGQYIREALTGAPGVLGISGMGLMVGIETTADAKAIAKECLNRGVVVLTAKNKVRLLPALNIPRDTLKKAVGILKEVIGEMA
ncbi:acetylornithine/succinylornithine family transaminase [Veillonella magna]|uniref:acetylornithine/succinylornithine family transaminase n=1 Tax=Veillonella magna TaxID=464322 RepID=UPI002666FC65|nr:acetylornithine/succinylornithine family transaminase [Veillonella magna]